MQRRAGLPATLALLVAAVLSMAAATPRDVLIRARQLYNLQQYDAAIMAAGQAKQAPELADAATLVAARSRLERFRRGGDQSDFELARAALGALDPERLSPRDRVDLILGLGVALYLDERTGAAAEQFELGLAQINVLGPDAREPVLDWWACALDRDAQQVRPADRRRIYTRIVQRMEDELRRDSGSIVATYWLAAAARGLGDIERAWNAAVAGWVRAPGSTAWGAAFRADLDRLVMEGIIPERARRFAAEGQLQQMLESMYADWAALKEKWAAR
jgi:hypothetical protein